MTVTGARFNPNYTSAYDFNITTLYENFEYVDFKKATVLYKNLNQKDLEFKTIFQNKLLKLKSIIKTKNFKPIFITQLKFDGLKDKKLFLVNNELKLFAETNDYFLIPLDEILNMQVNDFYDEIHTTPQGSKRIANAIYPELLNFFEKN